MADAPFNVAVAVIPKTSREELRVSLTEFKGVRYCDLRIFAEFTGQSHARTPTKAGVTCSFEHLPALVKALQAAEAKARELGLIGGAA